jgi:hypothetical protein
MGQINWGPYITVGLAAIVGILGWSLRSLLKHISDIAVTVNQLTTDVAILKDRQTLTAVRVGVTTKQLKDTEQ